MDIISSTQNPKFKQLVKLLASSKARRQLSQTILEGESLVRDFIESHGEMEWLIIDEAKINDLSISSLIEQVDPKKVIILKSFLLDKISQVDTPPGVLAIVKIPNTEDGLNNSLSGSRQTVLIDRVQDPTNLGAIIRSAVAFGVRDIYLSAGSVDPWSPKVIRSSVGAILKVNIHTQINLSELIPSLQTLGVTVYATSPHAEQSLTMANLTNQAAWLVGNEGEGVSQELVELVNETIKIPQSDLVESLNLAVATSLCLYEYRRQWAN